MPGNIYKRDIINFLFIVSFPLHGIGSYLTATVSLNFGYLIGCLAFIAIILFHVVDIVYQRTYRLKVNTNYFFVFLFYASTVAAFLIALHKGMPGAKLFTIVGRSALIVMPFHAFMVVYVYNEKRDHIRQMLLQGLTLLLLINLVGYFGLGLSNPVHSIDGRFNFPFIDSLYSGACLIAIINLILFYQIRKSPFNIRLYIYLVINLFFFFYINSRLVTLIFLAIILLMLIYVKRTPIGIFWGSIFTLPLLLSGGMLIFQILSLPFFEMILQRIDLVDVITFHGRSFLWERGIDWLLEDQRGVIFGNGFKGHYFLDLLGDIFFLFNAKSTRDLHMHSTTLEIVTSQGLTGLFLFFVILYKVYNYYKRQYRIGCEEGAFYPVVLFILFVAQVDGFLYLDNLGGLLFAFLAARISLSLQPLAELNTQTSTLSDLGSNIKATQSLTL